MKKKFYKNIASGILTFLLLGCTSFNAFCTDHKWTNSGGDKKWSNASNWDVNTVPGVGDYVDIEDLAGDTVYMDINDTINELYIKGNSILEIINGDALSLTYVANFDANGSDSPRIYVNDGAMNFGNSIGGMGGIVNCGKGKVYLENGTGGYTVFNADSSTITFGGYGPFCNMSSFYNVVVEPGDPMGLEIRQDAIINGSISGGGSLSVEWCNLSIKGDISISNLNGWYSKIYLCGTSPQHITNGTFYDLVCTNDSGTILDGNIDIEGQLTFDTAAVFPYYGPSYLHLNGYNLSMGSSSGFGSTDPHMGYIINEGGYINVNVDNTLLGLPIGTSEGVFAPLLLTCGTLTNFDIMVSPGVSDSDLNAVSTHALNATWQINPYTDATDFRVYFLDDSTTMEMSGFDRNNLYIFTREDQSTPTKWDTIGALQSAMYFGLQYYLTGFGPMTLTSGAPHYFSVMDSTHHPLTALPVELISFTAHPENGKNILDWSTASEINNDHFEIQRSIDAKNWTSIGDKPGHGTTNTEEFYSFIDASVNTLASSVVYYRLKQVDNNGAFEYSDIRKISTTKGDNFFKLYPNPAKDMLNISFNGNERNIRIFNMNGECVYTSVNENLQKQIDISSLSNGLYILKVYSATEVNAQVFCKE